jgi:hypothetical protein
LTKAITGVSYIHILGGRGDWMAKRLNFYLTDIQVKRLSLMSNKSGLTASEIIRRAIDDYWERYEKKVKGK